jgi:hypothetical protein
MPEFLQIENALKQVTKQPDKYEQTASVFQTILVDDSTTPQEKAIEIAKLIRKGTK